MLHDSTVNCARLRSPVCTIRGAKQPDLCRLLCLVASCILPRGCRPLGSINYIMEATTQQDGSRKSPCQWWLQGRCEAGSKCTYLHEPHDMHKGLHEDRLMQFISATSLDSLEDVVQIKYYQVLASYNWIRADLPSIIVPGQFHSSNSSVKNAWS